jgi:hypothetical protein
MGDVGTMAGGSRVPEALRALHSAITAVTSSACAKHLDSEFAELASELVAALARKRPSPLLHGRPGTWAAGSLLTLARTNFLFDKTVIPHCTPAELAQACGVSSSSAAAKARVIEDTLGIIPMDPRWTPPSRLAENPIVWLIEVNGVVLDARTLPREVQEQALRLGLIPFLPSSQ